mgnify:CR=1 FL=1
MGKGKDLCDTLKTIRKAVADANGIEYVPGKCTNDDECCGTCPACEAEVRYIERELKFRRLAGKAVTVAGIAIGAASFAACSTDKLTDDGLNNSSVQVPNQNKLFGEMPETQPSFPGGEAALMKYFEENMQWPDNESDISGRVIVQFKIAKDGTVKNPKVVRGLAPEFDAEALRLVRGMPKWIPGKISGKVVETVYTVPVKFRLR